MVRLKESAALKPEEVYMVRLKESATLKPEDNLILRLKTAAHLKNKPRESFVTQPKKYALSSSKDKSDSKPVRIVRRKPLKKSTKEAESKHAQTYAPEKSNDGIEANVETRVLGRDVVHKHLRARDKTVRRSPGFRLTRQPTNSRENSKEYNQIISGDWQDDEAKSPEASKLNLVRVKPPKDFLRLHKLDEFSESKRKKSLIKLLRKEEVIKPVVEQTFASRVPRLDDFETEDNKGSATEFRWNRSILKLPGRLSSGSLTHRSRTPRLEIIDGPSTDQAEEKVDLFEAPGFFGDFPDLPKFYESPIHHSFDSEKVDYLPEPRPTKHVPEATKHEHTYTDKYVAPDKGTSNLYVVDPWKNIDKVDIVTYTPKPYVAPTTEALYYSSEYKPTDPSYAPVYEVQPYKTTAKPYKPKPTYVYQKPNYRPPVGSKPHHQTSDYKPTNEYKPEPYKPAQEYKPEPYKPFHEYKPETYKKLETYEPERYEPVHEYKPEPYEPVRVHDYEPEPYKPVHEYKPEPYNPTHDYTPEPYNYEHNHEPEPYTHVLDYKPELYKPSHEYTPEPYSYEQDYDPKPYKPEHNQHNEPNSTEHALEHESFQHSYKPEHVQTYEPAPYRPAHQVQPHKSFSFNDEIFDKISHIGNDFSFDKHLDFSFDRVSQGQEDVVDEDEGNEDFTAKKDQVDHHRSDTFDKSFFNKPYSSSQTFERSDVAVQAPFSDYQQNQQTAKSPLSVHPLDSQHFDGFKNFDFPRDFEMSSSSPKPVYSARASRRRSDSARSDYHSIFYNPTQRHYSNFTIFSITNVTPRLIKAHILFARRHQGVPQKVKFIVFFLI